MNTAAKLGTYVLGLAVVFGGALGVGSAVGEVAPPAAEESQGAAHSTETAAAVREDTPGGLQMSENGYTLTPLTSTIRPGEPTDFQFKVTGPGGEPVTDYQVQHDKKLHFIVVSRDLTNFQHVHPAEAGGGVWTIKLTLPTAGAYRAFADFAPTGADGLTLGTDVLVAGDYAPKALPPVGRTSTVDGYTVTLDGDLIPGRSSKLTLKVSKDGKPVTDLQPYLGAYGHLVALRAGDLAYLHVHPDGAPGDGKTAAGPEITFYAEVPSGGDYRLFLDFQHEGTVRTADFTAKAAPAPAGTPAPAPATTHGEH
ncbi:hypothetical protein [Nonomuraea sp. NEAU-A123]|uniref:hypothetical protein n=1 Tax=Nonomuraea sp. NEAU-A123 TaxID=2839649 RepID=UPI001BE4366B|nr:hypothetical protein [Nonomuraea sp. NEAU-A123]MBT2234972.1 hypothetical protein [Nonomuraea sp. NEAU-A123]